MADVAPSTYFDEVVAVEPAVRDGESEAATDMLPSTEFDEIVSVEAIDIC